MTQYREYEGCPPAQIEAMAWGNLIILAGLYLGGCVLIAGIGFAGYQILMWLGESFLCLAGGVYLP